MKLAPQCRCVNGWVCVCCLPVPNEKPLGNKQTRPRIYQEVPCVQVPQTDSTRTFSPPNSCFLASNPFFHLAASPVAAPCPIPPLLPKEVHEISAFHLQHQYDDASLKHFFWVCSLLPFFLLLTGPCPKS